MKTLNRICYYLALVSSWYTAWRQRASPLHTARWIYFHELAAAFADRLSGTQILLAKKTFFHGLSTRVVAVKPTKTQRELGHVLLVGKHRSGKGLCIETNLLTWPHSVIVNDIKGELYHRTAGFREKGLGGNVFRFDPQGYGCRFDPLAGKTTDSELRSAATTLLYRPHEGQNAAFTERAITMLVAMFHAAILEGERLLPFTYKIMNEGLYAAATILEIISQKHNAYPNLAKKFLDTTYDQADFTSKFLQDCWSTLTARMNQILTKESVRCFTGSDFMAKDLITSASPVSVYLSWPEEHVLSLAPLIQLVWDGLVSGMIGYYDGPNVQGKGCKRVLCVLDEIFRTGLPKLPEYTTTVSGRNISFLISAQSIAQMDKAYGRFTAEVLRGQMDATLFYRPAAADNATPAYIEQACGYKSGFARSQTAHDHSTSMGESEQRVPLLPAHETKHMGAEEIIGLATGLHPFRETRLNRYDFPELQERGTMPPPTWSPLPDFDLTSSKKTHFTLPDGTPGDPLTHCTDHHRTGYEERGTAIWHRERRLPNGYLDPDKRY
jgi:type IV secretion system protein VirD4